MTPRLTSFCVYGIPINLGFGSFNLNNANNWCAYSFMAFASKQVSKIRTYATSVTGTLGANDLVGEIWSDSNGSPGTLIEARNTVTAAPTGAAVVEFTGFTTTLTAGSLYWFLIHNANGTPASNFIGLGRISGLDAFLPGSAGGLFAVTMATSTTGSGGAWSKNATRLYYLAIEYSDGSKEGTPCGTTNSGALQIYSSREAGLYFTTPANVILRTIGIQTSFRKTGTPTGNARGKLYTGSTPTLRATSTFSTPVANVASSSSLMSFFWDPYEIPASTIVRAVLAETAQADSSSNRFDIDELVIGQVDADLWPMDSKTTLSTNGGSSFAETNYRHPPFALILDPDQPYGVQAGGSGGGLPVLGGSVVR